MKNVFKLAALVASISLLTACGGGGGDGSATAGKNGTVEVGSASQPADCGMGGMPQQLVAAINAARAQSRMCGGVSMPANKPVSYWNTRLSESALRHSNDMASHGFFGHQGSDGSIDADRNRAAGYDSGGAGEILASLGGGTPSIDRAMAGWLASPGHCSVIMGAGSSEIGAACAQAGSTAYITVEFGN